MRELHFDSSNQLAILLNLNWNRSMWPKKVWLLFVPYHSVLSRSKTQLMICCGLQSLEVIKFPSAKRVHAVRLSSALPIIASPLQVSSCYISGASLRRWWVENLIVVVVRCLHGKRSNQNTIQWIIGPISPLSLHSTPLTRRRLEHSSNGCALSGHPNSLSVKRARTLNLLGARLKLLNAKRKWKKWHYYWIFGLLCLLRLRGELPWQDWSQQM